MAGKGIHSGEQNSVQFTEPKQNDGLWSMVISWFTWSIHATF